MEETLTSVLSLFNKNLTMWLFCRPAYAPNPRSFGGRGIENSIKDLSHK